MNVNQFLNYNCSCPLCGNGLTFFLQWFDEKMPWENEKLFICQEGVFREHVLNKSNNLFAQKTDDNKEFFFKLQGDRVLFNYQSTKKFLSSGTSYFYALCNPNSIVMDGEQFKIDLFSACYYRGSPYFQLPKLELSMVNMTESFSLSRREEDLLKIYILSQNYEEETSSLFHYTANKQQEEDELYMPETFEKTLPLTNIDVSDKDKLISRVEAWINFS